MSQNFDKLLDSKLESMEWSKEISNSVLACRKRRQVRVAFSGVLSLCLVMFVSVFLIAPSSLSQDDSDFLVSDSVDIMVDDMLSEFETDWNEFVDFDDFGSSDDVI